MSSPGGNSQGRSGGGNSQDPSRGSKSQGPPDPSQPIMLYNVSIGNTRWNPTAYTPTWECYKNYTLWLDEQIKDAGHEYTRNWYEHRKDMKVEVYMSDQAEGQGSTGVIYFCRAKLEWRVRGRFGRMDYEPVKTGPACSQISGLEARTKLLEALREDIGKEKQKRKG